MSIKKLARFFLICLLLASCSRSQNDKEKSKQEIAKAEKDFATMAAEKGIAEAFYFFADSNAVIRRQNDSLIKGKDNIRNYYSADFFKAIILKWSPDFIDVANNGDLGYTFGKYTRQSKDTAGKLNEIKGVFHTVWKKQNDGSWKYVWD